MSGVDFKDLGIGKLKQQLATLKKRKVTLGWQGESGARPHPNPSADGAPVAQIAAMQEYGTPTAPARPALQTMFDRHRDELRERVRKATSDLVDGRASDPDEALAEVGEVGADLLRKTIDDARSWAEPLAPSTAIKKGHDQPLIDYAAMRDSASYAVRDGAHIVKQGGEAEQ